MIITCEIENIKKVTEAISVRSEKAIATAVILDESHLQRLYQVRLDNEEVRGTLARVIEEGIRTLNRKRIGSN